MPSCTRCRSAATVAPGEGRLLLTGLRGASVWRATAPFDRLWQLDGQPGPVLAATFGDKGSTIATIGGDSSARIWGPPAPPEADNALHELLGGEPSDPNAYELRATFRGHRSTINAIAFSPRDMQLVVADRNGVIRVYPLDIAVYRQLACRLLHGFTEAYGEVEAFCRS